MVKLVTYLLMMDGAACRNCDLCQDVVPNEDGVTSSEGGLWGEEMVRPYRAEERIKYVFLHSDSGWSDCLPPLQICILALESFFFIRM